MPAHCGEPADVPPMMYQPVLHGVPDGWQIAPLEPTLGSDT
jgi:hypothetical protein